MNHFDAAAATKATADSERRLRHILEATPNAMVMVDRDGRVVLVNAQTERLFGYDRAELLSMTVEQLIPVRFRGRHSDFRASYALKPDTRSMGSGRDLYGLHKDGSEVPIEIGLNPMSTDEGDFVIASIIDITERMHSQERFISIVESAPNAMAMVDARGAVVLVNSKMIESFGYPREELVTMNIDDLLPHRLRDDTVARGTAFFAEAARWDMGVTGELFGRRVDGSEFPIELGLNPIRIHGDRFVLASIVDITNRLVVQAAKTTLREDALRRSILDSLPFSIIATDAHGTIVTANPAAERLLGYHHEELVGASFRAIHGIDADDEWPVLGTASPGGDDERESVYQRRDGTHVPVNEAIRPMHTDSGELSGHLTVAYDITERKLAQAAVTHLAHHDVLTDLPNRAMLLRHLDEAMQRAHAAGQHVAVLLLDLDHFKRVNDSLGHPIGDELLVRMAARLRNSVREEDLVSRLGGDEFVLVFSEFESPEHLDERIGNLLESVLAPIDVNGHELIITASMGGATYPADGVDPATLLKNADTAMYHAKTAGRNNFQWFFASMLDETNDKIALAGALRHAVSLGELSLAYQPQISLTTGQVVGMEALARWNSPQHGQVAPARFIGVAEDSGMITEVGEWALRQACHDGVTLHAALGRPIKLAVNVSPRQFRSPDWLDTVTRALVDSGFDPEYLELEITEGILMDDPREVVDVLHALRAMGIGIVVDDFGTGFSSLAYLTRFPIDKIKIDRSFVRDLTADDADAAIVDTIIVMAHTLNMVVVAEGIETRDQETYLRERGCDEAQGFRYSHGVGVAEFAERAAFVDAGGVLPDKEGNAVSGFPLGAL